MLPGALYTIYLVCLILLFLPTTIIYRCPANEKTREAVADDNNNNYTLEVSKSVNDCFSFLINPLLTHRAHQYEAADWQQEKDE